MSSAALINYCLTQLKLMTYRNGVEAAPAKAVAKIAKLEAQLVVARRRELKRLARHLQLKADVYGPGGRIYSHEAKWTVKDGVLYHGAKAYKPSELSDGHGRPILVDD